MQYSIIRINKIDYHKHVDECGRHGYTIIDPKPIDLLF